MADETFSLQHDRCPGCCRRRAAFARRLRAESVRPVGRGAAGAASGEEDRDDKGEAEGEDVAAHDPRLGCREGDSGNPSGLHAAGEMGMFWSLERVTGGMD